MTGAVLLAAGASRRMGEQKLLLPYEGTPMIRHIANRLVESGLDPLVVVTGHDRARVHDALSGFAVTFAHNEGHADGMLSSVRVGLQSLPAEAHVAVALGDHPQISPEVVRALVHTIEEDPSRICVPSVGGRRGHPLVFGAEYRAAVMERYDATGLRGLLHEYADQVVEVACDDPSILEDIDTPADYAAALRRLKGR